MPYIPPIQTWNSLEKTRNKNTNYILDEEVKKEETDNNTNIRGERSKILLVPDRREYYKGINVVKWYWYRLVYNIKKLLHKGEV